MSDDPPSRPDLADLLARVTPENVHAEVPIGPVAPTRPGASAVRALLEERAVPDPATVEFLARCPCGGEVWGRPGSREGGPPGRGCETWSIWCTHCDRPLRGPRDRRQPGESAIEAEVRFHAGFPRLLLEEDP